MEMKLAGTRIKELRLKLSWSQEKLAEEARLNPRTVQRAETDGSASLRTRLQLAAALQVQPEELDAEPGLASAVATATPPLASIYYLAILLLVSIVYLASQPAFFSLSVTNFSWEKFTPIDESWQEPASWWVMTIVLWSALSVPVLYYFHRRHPSLLWPYCAAFCAGLAMTILRLWQPGVVAQSLTALVSLCGLALLASLYLPRLDTRKLRHALFMCLSAYVFIWGIHDIAWFALNLPILVHEFGDFAADVKEPLPWFIAGILLGDLADLVQLVPVALVIALSFGERPQLRWPTLGAQAMPEPPVTP